MNDILSRPSNLLRAVFLTSINVLIMFFLFSFFHFRHVLKNIRLVKEREKFKRTEHTKRSLYKRIQSSVTSCTHPCEANPRSLCVPTSGKPRICAKRPIHTNHVRLRLHRQAWSQGTVCT